MAGKRNQVEGPRHTPGPWHVESGTHWLITSALGVVAKIGLDDDGATGPRYTRDANAVLLAAAPELLQALKLAFEQLVLVAPTLSNPEHVEACVAAGNRARSAITEAEGGA